MKKTIVLSVTLGILALGAFAPCAFGQTLNYRDARTIGMGDTKIAAGRGGIDFVSNPALLGTVKWVSLSIPDLPVYFSRDLLDMLEFVRDNQENFERFSSTGADSLTPDEKQAFLNDLGEYDSKWSRINLSPMVSVAASVLGMSVGAAVYTCADVAFKIDRGIYEPRVWGEGATNTVAVVGLARSFPLVPGMKIGTNFKYIDHRTAPLFQIKATDMEKTEDIMQSVADSANAHATNHMAMDIGTLMSVPFLGLDVAATAQNLGYAEYASVDFGVAKRLLGNRLLLTADYVDFLDNRGENVFKKLHFGGEMNLTVIKLRAGVNAGYPTFGAGLSVGVAQVDAAYYTEELSNVPGGNGDERLLAQVRIGF